MRAKTFSGKSVAEINDSLQKCLNDGFKPTLAFVFSSSRQDTGSISAILDKREITVFGATTSGEFSDGYQGEGSAVVMMLDLDPEHFSLFFEEVADRGERNVARMIGQLALQKFTNPAFIISATGNVETDMLSGDEIVRGLEEAVGKDVFIAGGLAGNDMKFSGTFIFTNKKISTKGLMMLVLDESKIELHGSAVSGWKALGTLKQVTKKRNDWILTIDNEPALDVFLKYMGRASIEGENAIDNFFHFSMAYPWQVQRENGSVALCTPVMFNTEDRSIQCEYPLPEGTRFRFSVPPDFDIVDEVIARSAEVKEQYKAEADALLIFSCLGRFLNLGPLAQEELEGLTKLWGVPMAGFFSYGEFGRARGERQEFHSTNISWVTLREK